jgi:hypothetical protein
MQQHPQISDARQGARVKPYRVYGEGAATPHRAEMERVEGIEPSFRLSQDCAGLRAFGRKVHRISI